MVLVFIFARSSENALDESPAAALTVGFADSALAGAPVTAVLVARAGVDASDDIGARAGTGAGRAGAAGNRGARAGAGVGAAGLDPPMLSEMVGGFAGALVCSGRSIGAAAGES